MPAPSQYFASIFASIPRPNQKGWALVRCIFHNDNEPSLMINLMHGGFNCLACGTKGGDIIQFERLAHGVTFKEALARLTDEQHSQPLPIVTREPVEVLPEVDPAKAERIIEQTWRWSVPISQGCPVDIYLRKRGLGMSEYPEALRYHPSLPAYTDGKCVGHYPAMLAKVLGPDGSTVTIHRTYLTTDGEKALGAQSKRLLPCAFGATMSGAAIRLQPAEDVLYITEGIETGLAIHRRFNVPVWCAVTSQGLKKIALPESIRTVFICGDRDRSGAGQRATVDAAARFSGEGREAIMVISPVEGFDWCDLLRDKNESY